MVMSVVGVAKPVALVLVYSAHCPYCQRFIPVVKAIQQKSALSLISFTVDEPSPLLPESAPITPPLIKRWLGHDIKVPALFLYSDTHRLYPVSVGFLSQSQLNSRLDTLGQKIRQVEEGRT